MLLPSTNTHINKERKVVFVTGSSRGIGKSIAIKFASCGYHVVINCTKRKDALLEVKQQVEAFGVQCLAFVDDLGSHETVERIFSEIKHRFHRLDVLVNNAGISQIGLLSDLDATEWASILSTNLTAPMYCCKHAIPLMLSAHEGKIINISSIWGDVGASCEVAYSATKGGINSMTKALAKELAPSNIQVNAISCGVIDTEMNAFLEEDEKLSLMEEIPANRLGTTTEVAEFAYQLATSPSYLTGQIIRLDGGFI